MAVSQFDKDCALLSGVADSKIRSDQNQFPVPEGYALYQACPQNTSGLDAVAYTNGNQIVISFAGTNTNFLSNDGLGDLITDIEGGLGNATTQFVQAAEYYMNVKNNNPDVTEFIFTGHSLGVYRSESARLNARRMFPEKGNIRRRL